MPTRFTLALLFAVLPGGAAQLSPAANREFDEYAASIEARMARQHQTAGTCLAASPNGATTSVEPVNGGTWPVTDALLHHWRAATFVPGVNKSDMLALLRDYGHLADFYSPDIQSSRVLKEDGGSAVLALRLRKQNIVTVALDAEYDVQSGILPGNCGYARSRSTHIRQIRNPGTPRERRAPEGDDDGFLWRLNAYWSFSETPRGLAIECEAISLTRDIPIGLAWLIAPIIRELPRTSLAFTLNATRNALQKEKSL